MDRLFLIFIIPFFLLACNGEKEVDQLLTFDSEKWQLKEGKDYPYRDQMLDDLVDSRLLKPMTKEEVLDVLGVPDRSDGLYLFYTVTQKRIGLFPLHTTTLVVKLSEDGGENTILIHE
ncbi:MAG: hypothetical protein GYB31_06570 [Bacteroidetes bacterium]|nr:hypothetical protein [Bacteroidota bacterium]